MSRRAFVGSVVAAPLMSRLGMLGARSEHAAGGGRTARRSRDHVAVVGAGAFGGWTALALLRAGMRVTLVDAWGAGHSRASSGGETRVIRAVYGGVPIYSEMAARALVLWREAEQQWKRQVLFRTGGLWMCATDDAYVRRSIEPMKAVGLSVEQLSPDDAARRYPQLSFRDVRTVFFEPEAGYVTARAACELVRETFVREGGEYKQAWMRPGPTAGARLSGITLSEGGGTLDADRFVFACGPWMAQVLPDVIGRRIVATRQEVFFFGTPAGDTRYNFGALP
ncbi:MAG: FAD-dependent oxidoreductase, partial [Gemmatimonadaceae bacterium]